MTTKEKARLYEEFFLRYLKAKRDFPNIFHDKPNPMGLSPARILAIETRLKQEFKRTS